MKYNLHFYEKNKLKEIITSNAFMYGEGNKFLSYDIPSTYDKLKLFDKDNRYIITYRYVERQENKSIFRR